MFIEDHDARVNRYLGNVRFFWKLFAGKRIEQPPFEYPILFGVELEYEVETPANLKGDEVMRRAFRAQTSDRLEPHFQTFAIAKRDGSLENGIEIVSAPMSIDAHSEQWKPFFAAATENGLKIKTNCGMHVHVSRELLTPLQIGKIIAMIFSKENAAFMKLIAGRSKPVWSNQRTFIDIGIKKLTDVKRHRERYSALNIRGRETIEFRFFKSTLDLNRMLVNLEFCNALVRLAWPSKASILDIQKRGLQILSDFIKENRKDYPHLFTFMKDGGFILWNKPTVPKLQKSGVCYDKKKH